MRNPYTLKNNSTEPNMRQELNNMFDGIFPEVAKSKPIILRKMRRVDGKLVKCSCIDPNTQEPDKDSFCVFCQGEGKFFDEIWLDAYTVNLSGGASGALKDSLIAPGIVNEPVTVFYLRSRVDITKEDRLIEVELDAEGFPVKPYRRKKLYRIGNLVDFRADNGKLEYWKVEAFAEQRKFLNGLYA